MNNWSETTLAVMGKRLEIVVQGITWFFAMTAALLGIVTVSPFFPAVFVLCFMTIPPIHYLCREVLRLRRKIEDLEKRRG